MSSCSPHARPMVSSASSSPWVAVGAFRLIVTTRGHRCRPPHRRRARPPVPFVSSSSRTVASAFRLIVVSNHVEPPRTTAATIHLVVDTSLVFSATRGRPTRWKCGLRAVRARNASSFNAGHRRGLCDRGAQQRRPTNQPRPARLQPMAIQRFVSACVTWARSLFRLTACRKNGNRRTWSS